MLPVQFITHTFGAIGYEESAMLALQGGCRWIQLRMKEATDEEVEPIARRLLAACHEAQATFIIDDRVALCEKIKANGVHLGKGDMPVSEARERLGHEYIIGGTANTLDDIRRLKRESADYVGCGPLRFTETKAKLAPTLGFEGYRSIIEAMRREELRLPLCAIGGITLEDVPALLEAGVQGIAVSGAVLRSDNPADMIRRFLRADEIIEN